MNGEKLSEIVLAKVVVVAVVVVVTVAVAGQQRSDAA